MSRFKPRNPELFLSAINQSIEEWSELRHVIEVYGAGGDSARDKVIWMGDVLFDYFKVTPIDMVREEIHDYIAQLVDNEFDFVPMDRSLDALIGKLFEYHSLWSTGCLEKMKTIMEERKKDNQAKQEVLDKESAKINEDLNNLAIGRKEEEERENNQETSKEVNTEEPLQTDSDGWTIVASKKKNKRK